jgi:biopolymer transport protein ExbD
MAGLTTPLDFKRHLRCQPVPGFDFVPFLDALMIFAFVALNASAFVLSPGTAVNLPASDTMETTKLAPTVVLTVDRNELYFFEGRKLAKATLRDHLESYIKESNADDQAILLLKADSSITSSILFHLMDIAREAGFREVHLAAEPDAIGQGTWNESESGSDS